MKKLIILALTLGCLTVSCLDNEFLSLDEIDGSIFLPDGPELFTITNVEQAMTSGLLRRITVNYTSVYDDLPPRQREIIIGAAVITPRRTVGLNPTRTSVVEPDEYEIGQNICYTFFFRTNDGDSRGTTHCFDVE